MWILSVGIVHPETVKLVSIIIIIMLKIIVIKIGGWASKGAKTQYG